MYYTIIITTVYFSSFAFFSVMPIEFSDISITSLNLFNIFFSLSFSNLNSFPHQQTDLSTDTQTSATSVRFCLSVATSRSWSTSSFSSFKASTSSSALPCHHNLSYLNIREQLFLNNFFFSMFYTCVLNLCLVISLPPLSTHNRCIVSIYRLTFLSFST